MVNSLNRTKNDSNINLFQLIKDLSSVMESNPKNEEDQEMDAASVGIL